MIRLFKRYYPVRNMFFVWGEGIMLFTTLALTGSWINSGTPAEYLLITVICLVFLYGGGLYDLGVLDGLGELVGRLILSLGGAAIILLAVHLGLGQVVVPEREFIQSLMNMAAMAVSWRLVYTLMLNRRLFDKTILVLGESPLIRSVLQEASQRKDSGYHLIHALPGRAPDHSRWAYSAPFDDMDENHQGLLFLAQTLNARLIVSDTSVEKSTDNVEAALEECRRNGMPVLDARNFFEMITGRLHTSQFIT